ncbi:hypothetical protein JQS43_02590 [Natronosporangium hydrolyticum]|uniref:Uncharacterized protein n=1 Tax=Natronosporangium hydrolyticum TaxID=2811111 RepID=A0A895YCP1_9ACTN|nr:hypothetical protein [Natronosporangium hydrolyticum]QSB15271.1 hypothetical protein JQS43_02590 [Natronosporangium hydrolyticum]
MLFFGLALLIGGVVVLYRYRVEIVDLLLRPLVPAWLRRLLVPVGAWLRRVAAWARPVAARLGPYLEPLRPWHDRLVGLQRRLASLLGLPRRLASLARVVGWLRRPPWPWRRAAGRGGGAHSPRAAAPGRVRRPLVGGRGVTAGRRVAGRGSGRRVYTPPRPAPGADGTLVRWVPGRAAVPSHADAVEARHRRDDD